MCTLAMSKKAELWAFSFASLMALVLGNALYTVTPLHSDKQQQAETHYIPKKNTFVNTHHPKHTTHYIYLLEKIQT